jgi:hypothetical protein
MILELAGRVFKSGVTKKEPVRNVYNVLVPRPDGQSDVVTVFTIKKHEVGKDIKIRVNAFIQMCNEVE